MLQQPKRAPSVCFDLEVLVANGTAAEMHGADYTIQEAPGACDTMTAIRELGGKCMVLAEESEVAYRTLQQTELEADEIIHRQIDQSRSSGETTTRIWGYVGNQTTTMHTARAIGVRAIGIPSVHHSAKDLWRSGADTILESLGDLSEHFKFPKDPSRLNLVTSSQAKEMANVSFGSWRNWQGAGILVTVEDAFGQRLYPGNYITRLGQLLKTNPRKTSVQLCALEWESEYGTYDARKKAIDTFNGEHRKGFYTMSESAQLMGYSRRTMVHWVARGFLPAIKIGGNWFCSKSDALRIKSVMDRLVKSEAAEIAGVAPARVVLLAREGKLGKTATPNGLRFDAVEVSAYAQKRRTLWGSARTAQELGVSRDTLARWRDDNILSSQTDNSRTFYDPEDVLRLKTQLRTINSGFDWIEESDRAAYTTKQAARRLGISDVILGRWAKESLLPFYNLPSESKPRRQYLSRYVDSLIAFAGSLPVSRGKAREFYSLCTSLKQTYGSASE